MKNMIAKIKIPKFFKTKKFFVFIFLFVLFFLFTPISLQKVGNQIENFINQKAEEGVQTFEKQTGLKIQWKLLKFNIFILTVKLEDVQIIPLKTANFQKIKELHFLNGQQEIKKISATPSLFHLLFKKEILLSKLKIYQGDIYIKTLNNYSKKTSDPKNIALPIKRIIIKDTKLQLNHQKHELQFSKLYSKIKQKKEGVFDFDFDVDSFQIHSYSKEKEQTIFSMNKGDKNPVYQFRFSGLAQKNKISFENIILKNENFQSTTEWLDVHFDSKGLQNVNFKSSGSLPSSLIQKGFELADKELFLFESLLSYELNIQYKKKKGYQGFFEVGGQKTIFKSQAIESFLFKGRIFNHFLAIDKGFIKTEKQGDINIKKGEWVFSNKETQQFNISLQTNRLSSDMVAKTILNIEHFPLKGLWTGEISCQGTVQGSYFKCSTEGYSPKIAIQPENSEEIMSLHKMKLNINAEWNQQILNFNAKNTEEDLPRVYFEGKYFYLNDKLQASYTFNGKLKEDLRFSLPFPYEGKLKVQRGRVSIVKDKIYLEGSINSPLLKIQKYKIKNISGLYTMKNNKLDFTDVRGAPNKSSYLAELSVDFNQKQVVLKSESSFFDIKDFTSAIEDNTKLPIDLQGTGVVSFFIRYPWDFPDKKAFQLKGNLFNVFVNKDFFQQASFDFGIENEKGVVKNLFFRKGQGTIQGTGTFDKKYAMNLNLTGKNLSLERSEFLNTILPFNQSGDVNFKMKATGFPNKPDILSDLSISNTFFYSYPVSNSQIQLHITKDNLKFSGQIMNQISIDKFVYPFNKNSKIEMAGQFKNFDFIKILFSKNRLEKSQDYLSKVTGSFSLNKNKKSKSQWMGSVKITSIYISRFNQWIKNESPFSIFFEKEKWSITPTKFSHNENKILNIEKKGRDRLLLSGESSLGLFSAFFPFLKKLEGNVKVNTLITNNLKKMNPKGTLLIDRGLFSLGVLPDFINLKSSILFSKNDIFIDEFTGNAGSGSIEGKGSVFYNFKDLPVLNLNLNFSNAHLNIPKDFNTRGKGQIQIKGSQLPYLISGEYAIDSGTITKDFSKAGKKPKYDFSFFNKEIKEQKNIFGLDIDIKTKQAVAVQSNLIRSAVEGQTKIYGPIESLRMKGQFSLSKKIEESLLFFRGQEFKINSGSIVFQNSPPENPVLDIQANTLFKEQTIDPFEGNKEVEKEYNIFLSVKGTAQKPVFSLKSNPPISEKEIISLLTLGVRSRYFDANVTESVTDYSYQILASLLLEKFLNKEIKNVLGVDFRQTPYINNFNKPVTKITLSKKWFQKWRTSFSRTIEEKAESDVRLKYDLNNKISLTAFWENTRQTELENNPEDRLGLDFEFNLDFQ